MPVKVKICGLSEAATLRAAVEAGAEFVGFNFYPPSPRSVTLKEAADLAAKVPKGVTKVGIFVDADSKVIVAAAEAAKLDLLQLHGSESPERVAEIKALTGLPVMKVVKLRKMEDLAATRDYEKVADRLLFDARPPEDRDDMLPGGNALAFDWTMLAGKSWEKPWMLAGGLTPANVREAIATTHAETVDVSSGVETSPGKKDANLIEEFVAAAKNR
ncbi:MAG: phosphoribosylanthranilate isomerase [Kiloniellales bacterium]|nr:phosphoribosylanthranilate isomerase [Kiloniellales bacterium]